MGKRERGERKYGKRDERKVEIGVEVKNGGMENEWRDWNLFKILYDILKFIVLMKIKIVMCINWNWLLVILMWIKFFKVNWIILLIFN